MMQELERSRNVELFCQKMHNLIETISSTKKQFLRQVVE